MCVQSHALRHLVYHIFIGENHITEHAFACPDTEVSNHGRVSHTQREFMLVHGIKNPLQKNK